MARRIELFIGRRTVRRVDRARDSLETAARASGWEGEPASAAAAIGSLAASAPKTASAIAAERISPEQRPPAHLVYLVYPQLRACERPRSTTAARRSARSLKLRLKLKARKKSCSMRKPSPSGASVARLIRPFHLAHHALVGALYLARQLDRRGHQLIRRHYAVDQPEPLGVPRVQIIPGKRKLFGLAHADRARQPRRHPAAGHHAHSRVRVRELRGLGR